MEPIQNIIKTINTNIDESEKTVNEFKVFLNNTKLKYVLQGLTKNMIRQSQNQELNDVQREIVEQPYEEAPFVEKKNTGGKTKKNNKKHNKHNKKRHNSKKV